MSSPLPRGDGTAHAHGRLDTDQAAAHVGVAAKTLANWRSAGKGPVYVKVGSLVTYREQDLDAWLETRDVVPASEYGRERAIVRDV